MDCLTLEGMTYRLSRNVCN